MGLVPAGPPLPVQSGTGVPRWLHKPSRFCPRFLFHQVQTKHAQKAPSETLAPNRASHQRINQLPNAPPAVHARRQSRSRRDEFG